MSGAVPLLLLLAVIAWTGTALQSRLYWRDAARVSQHLMQVSVAQSSDHTAVGRRSVRPPYLTLDCQVKVRYFRLLTVCICLKCDMVMDR